MTADVHVDGQPIKAVADWTIVENSTPLDSSDSSGGVGTISITFDQRVTPSTAKRMRRKVVRIDDEAQGQLIGRVDTAAGGSGARTITGQNLLTKLAVNRRMAPFSGTLTSAISYYLRLCGITDPNAWFVDETIALANVTLIGTYGNVWLQLKKLCTVAEIEISVVSDKIVVRPVRQRIGQNHRDSQQAWAIDDSQIATAVLVYYYEPVSIAPGDHTLRPSNATDWDDGLVGAVYGDDPTLGGITDPTEDEWLSLGLVYPPAGDYQSAEVLTVAAGEKKVVEVTLGASVTSLKQPIPVDRVAPNVAPAVSCYSISGNDTLPISEFEWWQRGGRITAKINQDTQTATLTIIGAAIPNLSPFTIGVDDGSKQYNTLRLVGTGIAFKKNSLTVNTGVSADLAAQDQVATIDNEFISSRDEAYNAAVKAMGKAVGSYQTISVNTTGINRIGDTGSYIFPPVSTFNDDFAGFATGAEFDSGQEAITGASTVGEFNAWGKTQVVTRFENQAFGNVAGARVEFDGSWYRIRAATITPGGISYSAEMDMLLRDLAAAHPAGLSVAEFNALYADDPAITVADWNTRPVLGGVQ